MLMSQRHIVTLIPEFFLIASASRRSTMASEPQPCRMGPDSLTRRPKRRRRSSARSPVNAWGPMGFQDSDIRIQVDVSPRSLPLQQRPKIQSHAMLLAQRERGGWRGSTKSWQWDMLVSTEDGGTSDDAIEQPQQRSWRPCAEQKIHFRALETPTTDAVLELEARGSYVLSLGGLGEYQGERGNRLAGERPSLALRFYGIPSPSVLERRERQARGSSPSVSPLLLTIPLGYESENNLPGRDIMEQFDLSSLVTTLPVHICCTSDWTMGVALLWPWRYQHRSQPGTLILFPLVKTVRADSTLIRTFTLGNIDTSSAQSRSSTGLYNLLWKVDLIPVKSELPIEDPHRLVWNVPAYLYFFDEGAGFLMTWVSESAWGASKDGRHLTPVEESRFKKFPKSTQLVRSASIDEWKERYSDPLTGAMIPSPTESDCKDAGGVTIHFSARFCVINLVEELLLQRPSLGPFSPDLKFAFEIISVSDKGRTVELAVAMETGNNKGTVAVVARVDILTQAYEEVKWWKRPAAPSSAPGVPMNIWCGKLATQCRMRHQRLGPYSVDDEHPRDWSSLCVHGFSGLNRQDAFDPVLWGPLTKKLEARPPQVKRVDLRGIPSSMLYNDCELIDNVAVMSHLPTMSIKCESASTELVYG